MAKRKFYRGYGYIDVPDGATDEQIWELLDAQKAASEPAPVAEAPVEQPKQSGFMSAISEGGRQVAGGLAGLLPGVINTLADIPGGVSALMPEANYDDEPGGPGSATYRAIAPWLKPALSDAASAIRDNPISKYLTDVPADQRNADGTPIVGRQAGEIAGQIATLIGGGWASAAPKAVGTGIGALQLASQSDLDVAEKRKAGVDISPEDAQLAAMANTPLALLDTINIGRLGRFVPGMAKSQVLNVAEKEATRSLASRAGETLLSTATGAATEAGQQFGSNVVKQQVYNPTQDLSEGVMENAIAGGGADGGLEVLQQMLLRRTSRAISGRKAQAVRARQTAPTIEPGFDPAISVRAGDDGQAEIKFVDRDKSWASNKMPILDAASKAWTGLPVSELSPETAMAIEDNLNQFREHTRVPADSLIDLLRRSGADGPPINPRDTGMGLRAIQAALPQFSQQYIQQNGYAPGGVDAQMSSVPDSPARVLYLQEKAATAARNRRNDVLNILSDDIYGKPINSLDANQAIHLDKTYDELRSKGMSDEQVIEFMSQPIDLAPESPEQAPATIPKALPANANDVTLNDDGSIQAQSGGDRSIVDQIVAGESDPFVPAKQGQDVVAGLMRPKKPGKEAPAPRITPTLPAAMLTDEGTVVDPSRQPTPIRRAADPVQPMSAQGQLPLSPTLPAPGPRKEVVQPKPVDVVAPVAVEATPITQEPNTPLSPEVAAPPSAVDAAAVAPVEPMVENPDAITQDEVVAQPDSVVGRLTPIVGEKYAYGLAADIGDVSGLTPDKPEYRKQVGNVADMALQYAITESGVKDQFGAATVGKDGTVRIKKVAGYKLPDSKYVARAQEIFDAVLGGNAPKFPTPKMSVETDTPTGQPVRPDTVASIAANIKSDPLPYELFTALQEAGADDIFAIKLVDEISNEGGEGVIAGKYANQIIDLSLKNARDLKGTLNHEIVHGFKALGLFNDTEWNILKAALNPNAVLSDDERAYYNQKYGNNPDLIQEEAIARAMERHMTGEQRIGGTAGRIATEKLGLLGKVGGFFKSKGMQSPEQVAAAFQSGEIGRRNFEGATKAAPDADMETIFQEDENEGYADGEDQERLSVQQAPVQGRIFAPPDPRTPLKKQWDEIVTPTPTRPGQSEPLKGRIRLEVLDKRAGVDALSRKAGNDTNARTSSIAATRNADVSSQFASAFLEHGAGEYVGTFGDGYFRARKGGPAPLGKNGFFTKAYKQGKLDQTLHYIAGTRAEKLMGEGRENLMTPQQIATYKSYGNDPEVKAAADQWKVFNDQMLDMLEASGRFDKATIDKWKEGNYLSFYRIDPDGVSVSAPGGGSLSSPGSIRALKGSNREIADPLENIVRNVNAITSMAMKNEAIRRVSRDGLQYGYMKPAVKGAKNTVTAYVDGKPKRYEVTDQLLYDSVTASNIPLNTFFKLAVMPGNFLRESVTLSPPFMIRNMLRDSMAVWAQGYTPAPFLNIIGDATTALSEGKSFTDLERLGVVGTGIRGEGGASGTADTARDIMDPSRLNPLSRAKRYIDDKSRKSEATNRIAVYDSVMKRTGGDEAQAAYEARELLNFNRRGKHQIAQVLTAMIPFQNARWQGLDVGVRSALGRGANKNMRRQMITRAASMAAMTSVYTALVSQLPAWQNATEEERENSWFVPTGTGEAVKIPVPFEFGFVAKIIPERLTAMMMGQEEGKQLLSAFERFVRSTMKVDYEPQAVAPWMEVVNNKDKFRNREIEGPWMRKLEKNYRADESTTELAKGIAPYTSLSPLQVDHLLRGYLGTTGMYAANLIDFMMGPQPVADIPDRKMSQMPVFGSLFQREDGARKLIEFYAVRDAAEQAAATLKAAAKARTPLDKAERDRMAKGAQFERRTRKADERMSQATRIERQIREDVKAGRLTPSQGRKTLEELRGKKLAIAEPVVKLGKQQ